MLFNRNKKKKDVFPSTRLVPIEYIRHGVVKNKMGEYYIIFECRGPNIFLKNDKEQLSYAITLKEFITALHPGEKIQILIVSRIMHILPYLEKLNSITHRAKGKMKQISQGYIDFIITMLKKHDLMERMVLMSVSIQIPKVQDEEEADEIALEIARRKIDEVTNFASNFGVSVRMLSTKEIIEYLFREYNPDIASMPEISVPDEVVFVTTLSQESYAVFKEEERQKQNIKTPQQDIKMPQGNIENIIIDNEPAKKEIEHPKEDENEEIRVY